MPCPLVVISHSLQKETPFSVRNRPYATDRYTPQCNHSLPLLPATVFDLLSQRGGYFDYSCILSRPKAPGT